MLTLVGIPSPAERAAFHAFEEAGFDVHLVKPVDWGRLRSVMSTASARMRRRSY